MISKKIYNTDEASSCYFRTSAIHPNKKIILQITERCNMSCAHCFVSSKKSGRDMRYEEIENIMLPSLKKSLVKKITLTGGEPMMHPKIFEIVELFSKNGMSVTICTNGSILSDNFLEKIKELDNIYLNVSLDGFSTTSYDRFRGNRGHGFFDDVISNLRKLSNIGLLKGILVTPNTYTGVEEYVKICDFAREIHAEYVLMNPLSEFGRGNKSKDKAVNSVEMKRIKDMTLELNTETLEVVYIRFPNDGKPLGKCSAGNILYVFANGDIAFCPYLVFASRNDQSKYGPNEFIIGNILNPDHSIDSMLKSYKLEIPRNHLCCDCELSKKCGGGCPASKVAKGDLLSDLDTDLCPFTEGGV